jgi:VanZ family protein
MPQPEHKSSRPIAPVICAAYLTALMTVTHLPPSYVPGAVAIKGLDNLIHFVGYAILAVLAAWAFLPAHSGGYVICGVILFVVAGVDELTQPLVGRCASLTDWAADAAGVVVGLIGRGAVLARISRDPSSS